jgi:glyoxylase-like metal-dependent hydrolase (beta-lactamase superfamily II)
MPDRRFPPQLVVFVRDWLSANNILLKSRDGHVFIDTGYSRHAPLTQALLSSARGIGAEPLAWIVNTHCHSDHVGGNAAIALRYDCPIAVPVGEAPLIERWDQKALLYDYCDQQADRFRVDKSLVPNTSHIWGDLEWRAVAAPGHDMGALVFYNPEHRILISGDALWEGGFGIVMPPEIDREALPATRATLEAIARLDVLVVIPGHGEPFVDVAAALARAFRRVEAFEASPMRMARHVVKALLTFTLLDRQRLMLADLPAYLDRIGIYRDFNRRFFRLQPAAFAAWIVGELEKTGAVRTDAGFAVPGQRGQRSNGK